MSTSRITLACLDMAGTTIDDGGVVEASFGEALASVGIDVQGPAGQVMLEFVRETMGTSKIAVFRALLGEETRAQAANEAFERAYDGFVKAGQVTPIVGADASIKLLQSQGVKVALLTGFSAPTRDSIIEAISWQNVADTLICPTPFLRGRPYPDMVLHAIIELGIDDVAEVAVVGDTAADIATGRSAGASIVAGVLTGADDKDRLEGAGASHVLGSITELPELLAERA